jgi:hypothetical protein
LGRAVGRHIYYVYGIVHARQSLSLSLSLSLLLLLCS